jgi:hypothetical protein
MRWEWLCAVTWKEFERKPIVTYFRVLSRHLSGLMQDVSIADVSRDSNQVPLETSHKYYYYCCANPALPQLHRLYSVNGRMIMNDELERMWKETGTTCLRYCQNIFLSDWRKPLKTSVSVAGLGTENRSRNLLNTKKERWSVTVFPSLLVTPPVPCSRVAALKDLIIRFTRNTACGL